MSEERFNSTVEEIKKIFLFLTEQEPSPDDEIEAREKLIDLFKNLKKIDAHLELDNLIEEIIDELNDWDTLDLWFKEVKELVSKIRKIVNIDEENSDIEVEKKIEEEMKMEPIKTSSSPELDIAEIVAQVADQFKGQIENLKGQIEQLQGELEKKAESMDQIQDGSDGGIREELFEETDDYSLDGESIEIESLKSDPSSLDGQMKLAPPKIRIPPLKEPQLASKPRIEAKSTDIEELELTPVPKMASDKSKITPIPEGEITEVPKPPSGIRFKTEIIEEPEKIPVPVEKAPDIAKEEKKIKISPEVIESSTPVDAEEPIKAPDFTPIPALEPAKPLSEVEKLESFLKDTQEEEMVPIPAEEPSESLTEIGKLETFLNNPETKDTTPVPAGTIFTNQEEPKKIKVVSEVFETSEIESIPIEEPFKVNLEPIPDEEDESLPFNLKKPTIKLEDIEDESLPSSKSDLFDVFSSVGGEIFDKGEASPELIEAPPEEDKKKKGEKKKEKPAKLSKKDEKKLSKKEAKKETKKGAKKEAPSPVIFEDIKTPQKIKEPDIPVIDLDKLPKDKDSLYQDLIALEGKRYSLERSLKQLQQDLVEKTVDEHEFENRSNDLKAKMKKISISINTIRKNIAKLK